MVSTDSREGTYYRVRYEYGMGAVPETVDTADSWDEARELALDALDDYLFITHGCAQAVTIERIHGGRAQRVARWELVEGRWVRRGRAR
jgi:hypothetical protein